MFWAYDDNDEMPPMTIETKVFKVEPTIEYKNALEGILKLGGHESTTIKAIAIQKAQQSLNGFLYYDELGKRNIYNLKNYRNPKLDYIVEVCKKEKTIVGYRFQEDGASIENVLTEADINWTNNIDEFRTGHYQVLVLQCSEVNRQTYSYVKTLYTTQLTIVLSLINNSYIELGDVVKPNLAD